MTAPDTQTPRTDDIALYMKGGTVLYGKRLDDDCGEVVPADLARTLERELSAALGRVKELELERDGFVLVPREPTDDMATAGMNELRTKSIHGPSAIRIYRAMLDAHLGAQERGW